MSEPLLDVTYYGPAAPLSSDRTCTRNSTSLIARPDLVVCDDCDAVHQRVALQRGDIARCLRCNALLGRSHVVRVQGLLAFAIGALLLLLIGNVAPIVTLDLNGVVSSASLPQAIEATWEAGQPLVAMLAAASALVFPLCFTLLRLYVLLPLSVGKLPPGFVPVMRTLNVVTRWSMVEVFLMGTLVAVVRSASLASATPGIGLFAYAALTLLLTSITAAGLHTLWKMGSGLGVE